MPIDTSRARSLLKHLDLQRLFVEEFNWANPNRRTMSLEAGDGKYQLKPVAEQGGMVVFEVADRDPAHEGIPDRSTRLAVHNAVLPQAQEHILVFVNRPRTATVWTWVEREGGRRVNDYHHRFHVSQPGDSLLQKLQGLAFPYDELDEEGKASIVQVTERVRGSLATERVTKRFYEEFQRQHGGFLEFIEGIDKLDDKRWYASVMLNRLMFIYFVQRKGFLHGDPDYLRQRLQHCRSESIPYYRGFLVPLFFEGFAARPEDRSPEANALLGEIPYLNGGLFMPHQIEQANDGIDIPDQAFADLYGFFDRYQWHLDDRPLRADNEINPDVLGYIFEKYINQKQMGAYYTKEDITEYICRNTVLPFLFDKLQRFRREAVEPLPVADVDPYLFPAMSRGVDLPLPPEIAAGLDAVPHRTHWNRPAAPDFANPTETWREHIARRRRVEEIRAAFAEGRIASINDFITYNLDIVQFTQDFLADTDDPLAVRAFYFECLRPLTVLDPTCGSGAFLFAALNILEPLYELCLQRMAEFLERKQRHPQWAQPFEQELARVADHPNPKYFVYKSIIVGNLFGVDIMDEAVEICKLRLFLKLVAQVEDPAQIEPLPDIDFNIRAGNTLVGYATLDDIERAKAGKLDFGGIVARVKAVDRHIQTFRGLQMDSGISAQHFREAKANLQAELRELEAELNQDLAFEYGVAKSNDFPTFVASHKPFHWYVEFYDILQHGGFDVIVGNPPFLEVREVEYRPLGYAVANDGPIHSMCAERSVSLLSDDGRMSMVYPMALVSTQRMTAVQKLLEGGGAVWYANFGWRPAKLFENVNRAISIFVTGPSARPATYSTGYQMWASEMRDALMPKLSYTPTPRARDYHWCPKLSANLESSILAKCFAQRLPVAGLLGDTGHQVFYRTTGGLYWKVFTDFAPAFRVHGRRGHSSRETSFAVEDPNHVRPLVGMLSSSLFWWWYTISSTLRDLNPSDVQGFPVAPSALHDPRLGDLSSRYLDDLVANSTMLVRNQSQTGRTETQSFEVRQSKLLLDEIDRVLAEHYGFTDEELDFIINYDIKYRMGGAEEGEE